jgi:hypothetical protein
MAHPDLDALLDQLFPFAQQMLDKNGEFYPFGAAVTGAGEIKLAAGDMGSEHPDSQSVIDTLLAGFKQQAAAGEVRAVGICLDVRVLPPGSSDKSDAICARLEHENGETVQVYMPYRKARLTKKVTYEQLFATAGERVVFQAS